MADTSVEKYKYDPDDFAPIPRSPLSIELVHDMLKNSAAIEPFEDTSEEAALVRLANAELLERWLQGYIESLSKSLGSRGVAQNSSVTFNGVPYRVDSLPIIRNGRVIHV